MMIINQLVEIQRREGLTDTEIAQRLGFHPISWNRIKKGRANFGEKFLRAVLKAYPELTLDVMSYLQAKER